MPLPAREAEPLSVAAHAPAATTTSASTRPATTRAAERPIEFPGILVDRSARQIRVVCEALGLIDTPLEFLCVQAGGPEHEAVLRTAAKPSHIHASLLLLGLTPGSPVAYDETANVWTPPHGPGVRAVAEWVDANGQAKQMPAEQLMRSIKLGTPMQPTTFIFAGSHVRPADGVYLADLTGYVLSICNFEHTLLDVPRLVSSSNATLEWETNPAGPAKGTRVTLILEPVDAASTTPVEDPRLGELKRRRDALRDEASRLDAQIETIEGNAPGATTRTGEQR